MRKRESVIETVKFIECEHVCEKERERERERERGR